MLFTHLLMQFSACLDRSVLPVKAMQISPGLWAVIFATSLQHLPVCCDDVTKLKIFFTSISGVTSWHFGILSRSTV